MRISLKPVALLLCLLTPAWAKPPAETAFDEWLDAFNRNDRVALTEFNTRRFGEPKHNIEYLLDSREETGGLDVVASKPCQVHLSSVVCRLVRCRFGIDAFDP